MKVQKAMKVGFGREGELTEPLCMAGNSQSFVKAFIGLHNRTYLSSKINATAA